MKRLVLPLALIALFTAACQDATTDPASETPEDIAFKRVKQVPVDQSPVARDMSEWNAKLAEEGLGVQVAYFEYITAQGSDKVGRLVFASDRGNKQLDSDWVPNDPRNGTGRTIFYLIDEEEGEPDDLTKEQTSAAIHSGMQTWEDIQCSNIPIQYAGPTDGEWGLVQWLEGFGGQPDFYTAITHAGWLPKEFFDAIEEDGGSFILGVTVTLTWISPADLDNNGKSDVALKEIYYNDAFEWGVGNPALYDVETIAHHEVGHGLSQAHFGDIFGTFANGKVHFAPLAVMNAAYSGIRRSPTGTDIGGHCSNWAEWPNR